MSGGARRRAPRARARQTMIQRRRRQREERKRGGHSFFFWGPLALLALALIAIGGVAAAAWGVYASFADDLVEPEAILDTQRALGTSKVFDSGGAEEGTLLFQFADPLSGLRNPVRIEDVSSHLINATVATEDGSFFENSGINTRGLARAAWENLGFGMGDFFGGSGGSSITQQLVKNVLIPPEERSGRTIERAEAKLKESILAIELTQQYSKLQILEWYLNTIFYGNLSYGIGAAAERYFGRPAADLALHEAALLAGMPQAPALLDPFEFPEAAKARQGLVLDLMERNGYITAEEAAAAKQQPLNFASREFSIEAPHFVTYVAEEVERLCGRGRIPLPEEVQGCEDLLTEGGLRITTTLDLDLQRQAEEILRQDLATFEEQTGAHNAALVALDPATGEIRAMVGSRDFFREDIDGQVNLVTAENSPGSSIKPITYAAAFVRDPREWNPGTIVWDVPLAFREIDGTVFSPENFDAVFRGPVSVRTALANSINVAAFRVAEALGTTELLHFAHEVGITTMAEPSNYGPSLTLGGGEVSLLDMAYAYSVFANNGVMRGQRTVLELGPEYRSLDPVSIREIRDSRGRALYAAGEALERQVMPAPQAFQITSILSDNQARAILYGLESNLVLDRPAAAKTGTAGDPGRNDVRRDYWTMGYTPDLVAGVWVGNADNTAMTGGSSSRTAGLIWRDFMLAAHAGLPAAKFERPEGLTTSQVFIPRLRPLQPGERREARPQNPCGTTSLELFVAEGGVPARENGICMRIEVDARTLQRAGADTPSTWLRDDFFLVPERLPATAQIEGEPAAAILRWLGANRVRFVGEEVSGETVEPLALKSPRQGSELGQGFVLVQGRAQSEEFERWTLEYAPGRRPADDAYRVIRESETTITGPLGRWDTRELEPGAYVLRLRLEDGFLGELSVEVTVEIVVETDPLREFLEGLEEESGEEPAAGDEGEPSPAASSGAAGEAADGTGSP